MLANRHVNLGFLVYTTVVFTILIVAYFVTSGRPKVFPNVKPSLGQEKHYIGTQEWKRNDTHSRPHTKDVDQTNSFNPYVIKSSSDDSNYIITQTYGGQMTRAIRNMMLQQCWGTSLGYSSYIVEPFSADSNLYHSVSFWNNTIKGKLHTATRFSDYYDIEHYNLKSRKDKSLRLVTWENFVMKAPRTSVVFMVPEKSCSVSSKNSEAPDLKLSSNCSFTKPFQDFITGLEKYNFHVIKVVCVHCSELHRPLTLKKLHEELYTGHQFSKITVLMNTWRNFAFTSSWLQLPRFCRLNEHPATSNRLRPSLRVIKDTQYYTKNILGNKGVIAVMLRIERFLTLQVSRRIQNNLNSCINATLEIHDKIKKSRDNTERSTFLTMDVGRFGSHVMQQSNAVSRLTAHGDDSMESINSIAENTIKHIYNRRFTLKTWENTFVETSGGITEMGYISIIQRNIATEADCLILMGGGSFQQVAAYHYLKKHPDSSSRCLHTICVAQSFEKSLSDYNPVQ